jgi:hypothetical protein
MQLPKLYVLEEAFKTGRQRVSDEAEETELLDFAFFPFFRPSGFRSSLP